MCDCITEIRTKHLDPIGADFKGVETSLNFDSESGGIQSGIIFRLIKKGTNRAHPQSFVKINNCPFCGEKLKNQ